MAQVERDLRKGMRALPGFRDEIPRQQPVLRQLRPRRLRELPPRVPQVALQTGQSDDHLSGFQGLRADTERVDHPHENHPVLSGAAQAEPDTRQEDRKGPR